MNIVFIPSLISQQHKLKSLSVVYGQEDPFFQSAQIDKINTLFKATKIDFKLISFEGKHELNKELMASIIS